MLTFVLFGQVSSSFKALAQANPDMAMGFIGEVAKKLGVPHKEVPSDQVEQQQDHSSEGMQPTGGRTNMNMPNLTDAASRMDIDSRRHARDVHY